MISLHQVNRTSDARDEKVKGREEGDLSGADESCAEENGDLGRGRVEKCDAAGRGVGNDGTEEENGAGAEVDVSSAKAQANAADRHVDSDASVDSGNNLSRKLYGDDSGGVKEASGCGERLDHASIKALQPQRADVTGGAAGGGVGKDSANETQRYDSEAGASSTKAPDADATLSVGEDTTGKRHGTESGLVEGALAISKRVDHTSVSVSDVDNNQGSNHEGGAGSNGGMLSSNAAGKGIDSDASIDYFSEGACSS